MKMIAFCVCVLALFCLAAADSVSPVNKVLEMLGGLQTKIIAEGQEVQTEFEKVSAMCEDRARELKFEIKTGTAQSEELTAVIEKASADIESLAAKVDELTENIGEDETELKKATALREKEAADFSAAEKELTETIDSIDRASTIIEKEMAKGASMAQLAGASNVASALSALVQASAIEAADRNKLTALIQSQNQADDESMDAGAPAAATYEGHSDGIISALDGLAEKAQENLADVRKTEAEAKHAYEMKKQSLTDQLKFANNDLDASKKGSSAAKEKKAVAEGELSATTEDLKASEMSLEELQHDCMEKATAYEEETKSRGEELKALGEAKKVIEESTGGAAEQVYVQEAPSFVQMSESSGSHNAARIVRRLAFTQHSAVLARLASRVESAMHNGADPFGKVKGLIGDMLEKLEAEAAEEATQKAFCDKETSESTAKKEDSEAELEKMTTKIDKMSADSAKLKEQITVLSSELLEISETQAKMDQMRQEQKEIYEKNKPELEQGVKGIQMALQVLRDYYSVDASHDDGEGAASGIIGLLEVCESDFSKQLAEIVEEEEAAVAEYDTETKDNAITKAAKTKDTEYKTKEAAALDKATTEMTSDKAGAQEQLDAVLEYLSELDKQCVAKAESYADRVARRDAEIAGLKSAMQALSEEDESLLQKSHATHRLRGHVALRA